MAAGRDLTLQASANAVGGHSVSRIDAGGDLALVAGRDLTLQASQLAGGDNVVLQAGQDLRLEALSNTRKIADNRSSSSITTHQVVDIQAGGDASLSAGRDALLQGSRVDAGGALALVAGRDVDIQAVVDERSVESRGAVRRGSYQRSEFDQTVRGAELTAGGDIAIVGGRDVTLEAAYVGSDAGGVAIGAGRDLSLIAAEEQHNFEQTTQTKKSGLFSSKRTTTYDRVDETLAVGTTISGETVDLSAGRDMSLIAAQVAGTGDVSLMAGRDLLIGGAQETYSATHDTQTRKSGLFGSGGIGVTWGTRETRNTADIEETTHIGSLIGSSAGRVDIVAGGDVAIVGSDVLSKAGIGISGENVAIVAADSTMTVEERQTMRQSGLNISLSGGVIDTAMAVYGAARRASEVDDDRLAALYAAKAGQTFAGAGNMATDASSQFAALGNTNQETAGGGGSSGINLRIGYGASSSTSTSELAQNTHTGSRIGSEGDVSIVARSGDLAVVGSTIDGDNIALVAANDILLRSSQDVSTHTSRSESQSGEVGITIGTEAGIGVYVAAAMAKGRGDGSGLVHNETVVTAANGLTFVSGNDTTLQGAQLIGETVTGRVGGNFTLISEQDADTFDRKDTSISGSAAIGAGGGSANIAFSQSKVNSEYLSVREQTGVQAGSGGFDIEVGGHTQLDGAALASASTNNRLSTGTLGWSDLENRAEYKASSISFSAGTSGNDKGSSGSFSPELSPPQSDSASSTTRAGIAAGTIEARDGAVDLSGLNRDVTALQQEGLKTIFDERKVAERMEMGEIAGQVGFQLAGDLSAHMRDRASAELEAAQVSGDPSAIEAAQKKVNAWSEGGYGKTVLHGVTGAAMAALGGGDAFQGLTGAVANQVASNAMHGYLLSLGYIPGTPEFDSMLQLGSLAVGAVTGGGTGAAVALSATQNNYLNHAERMAYLEAALACAQAGEACGRAAELEVLSESRNDVLRNACADRASSACQGALQSAIEAARDHQSNQLEYLSWMASNGRALWSAGQEIQNESLIRNIVTQTTTGDLVWKIDCANAGSNCSKFGSAQLLAQGDVASALRHEAMRAALVGAGQVGGIGGRAVDTVTGLGELLGESNTVVQGLRVWSALEYVNEHGLAAYIELEQAKSRDMRQALLGSAKSYFGDIGSALQNNALGGPQWDIYDVLMQGNTEGKVGFDVAGLFFGGTEVNAFAKAALAERRAAAVVKNAQEEIAISGKAFNDLAPPAVPPPNPRLSLPSPDYKVPDGYTLSLNPDGSAHVVGPLRAHYNSTGNYSPDGKPIFRDSSGGYVTFEGGRTPVSAPPRYDSVQIHHICTNKCEVGSNGKIPWTREFQHFFDGAGLDINRAMENLVEVPGHRGPHPEAYHQHVYGRLDQATRGLTPNTSEYNLAVTGTLNRIKSEAVIRGSQINKWLTNPGD
ncbi:hemagglutinin repeat-containing protein [Luteimonas sp. WGS1318]|uniref:hemagglutinin repeat-containing protein n=1 Tax=Luteimonas sp. WGS1318 TaxID=3366815 RepID=UPI00372D6B61